VGVLGRDGRVVACEPARFFLSFEHREVRVSHGGPCPWRWWLLGTGSKTSTKNNPFAPEFIVHVEARNSDGFDHFILHKVILKHESGWGCLVQSHLVGRVVGTPF